MDTAGSPASPPRAVVDRLVAATSSHDLDALVDCFAPQYRNETPAHPLRGFTGREQVRRNWAQIFAAVPDLAATVVATAENQDSVWTEWELGGRRRDGTTHLMRGVIVFTIARDQISAARFYLEPVETHSGNVDAAVGSQLAGPR